VLPGAPLAPVIGAWKVWKTGLVPTFAFEFVARGVHELVVLDPDFAR
jgi:hypothetical protein